MQVEKTGSGNAHATKLVEALAKVTHRPVEEARKVYESELERLEGQASVRHFLPVLAARHAKRILNARH